MEPSVLAPRAAAFVALSGLVSAIAVGACGDERRGDVVSTSSGAPQSSSGGDASACSPPTDECTCLVPYSSQACFYIPCGQSICFASRPGLRYDCSFGGRLEEVRATCEARDAGPDADASTDASAPADAATDAPNAD